MISIWKIIGLVVVSPLRAFGALHRLATERHMIIMLVCIAITTTLSNFAVIRHAAAEALEGMSYLLMLFYVVFAFFFGWAFLVVYTAIVNRLNRISDVIVESTQLCRVFAFALLPQIIFNIVQFALLANAQPDVSAEPERPNPALDILSAVWTIALLTLANSAVTRLPLLKSLFATSIPLLLFFTVLRYMLYMANIG